MEELDVASRSRVVEMALKRNPACCDDPWSIFVETGLFNALVRYRSLGLGYQAPSTEGDVAAGDEGDGAPGEEDDVDPGKDDDVAPGKENVAAGNEGAVVAGRKKVALQPWMQHLIPESKLWREDTRNMGLLLPNLTRGIRCQDLTEEDKKLGRDVCTRFCQFNIAFFDLDKESKVVPRPRIQDVPVADSCDLYAFEDSVNVISIRVAESDLGYPINVYGTVLASDQYDYRCVYLFKRGRDNPQHIKTEDDTLTLTGPFRALAVTDSMFFEFHLKIKCDGADDKDFSKGWIEHSAVCHTRQQRTASLEGWLSKVVMVYSPVPFAMEASLELNISEGPSNFTGKVTACTTGNVENEIILYHSDAAGTQTELGTNGSVSLTRRIVAVPVDEGLVLNVSNCTGDHEAECKLVLSPDAEEYTGKLGPYLLHVKVIWRAVLRERRPKMWERIGDVHVLW